MSRGCMTTFSDIAGKLELLRDTPADDARHLP
jgi:hypothetical protein